jgi:hypothetical protein
MMGANEHEGVLWGLLQRAIDAPCMRLFGDSVRRVLLPA